MAKLINIHGIMHLYLNPSKDKIPLIFPLFVKRILGAKSLSVCRNVSNTSDSERSRGQAQAKARSLSSLTPEHLRQDQPTCPGKPIRLGICRLASGKLQVISSATNQGVLERESPVWNQSNLMQRRESSLMFATVSKPSSLIVFQDAGNGRVDKHDSECSLCEENDCDKSKQSCTDELPLLFSLGNRNYEEALNTIGAARDAGNLCQSAAAQLKDICHDLHMQDAIWAAAKPCQDRVDDIIIRKEYCQSEATCSNTENQSISSKVNTKNPNASAENLPRRVTPSCDSAYSSTADQPFSQNVDISSSISSGNVCSYGDENLPVLQCVGTGKTEKKINDPAPSDGPSKEQLSYMHHRLSDEMPRFFEQSHDYGLYADTVHFDNRIMKVNTRGLSAYKATVQSLKYLSTAYLTNSQMEVLRITIETEQHCIQARWRIKGVPLHSYILRPWGRKHRDRYFDAFSTFYVGNDGLIHRHVLDKVMPSSEGKVVAASWAVRLGIALGVVRPPAFETDIMKAITHMKSLLGK